MTRQLLNNTGNKLVDPEQLGFQDINQFDWSTHVADPSLDENWWIGQKQANPGEMTVNQASQRLFNTLQDKQHQIFELVVNHYQKTLNIRELAPSQLLLQVDGKAKVDSFSTTLRIYGKKANVFQFNRQKLQNLQVLILPIYVTNDPSSISKLTSDEAGNLHNELLLCIEARVMLTENLWTENSLVNGAIGTIQDIQWTVTTVDFRKEPPFVILVEFDKYSGPSLEGNSVPIFRSTREFMHGSTVCQRVQFPLTVAYAITIHKSQGITVEKAVLNLVEKDFAPGLSYVAVSRVKTLDGLMFEESFDYNRFKAKETNTQKWRLADIQRRKTQHVQTSGGSRNRSRSTGSSGSSRNRSGSLQSLERSASMAMAPGGPAERQIEVEIEVEVEEIL
ncbi:Nucleoside-triphosphate phosphatase, partial [Scytalidium lignicola]